MNPAVPDAEHTLAQAFERLWRDLAPARLGASQTLALAHARGRILARAQHSTLDLPGTDVAAMDGYAVRAQDLAAGARNLRLLGRALAGHPFAGEVSPGGCVRTMTGAPLPAGSDALVVLEAAAEPVAGSVLLPGPVSVGANRRSRGEHVRAGETVLEAGRLLQPADLALLAALGVAALEVLVPLRVGVLSTGDELQDAPATLPPGGAYDSNRPMILAALGAAGEGVVRVDLGICPDAGPALARVLDRAGAEQLDVIVVSGGAAQGDADIVRSLEGVQFLPLAIRPGRGLAYGLLPRGERPCVLLGLPGNAVAAYVVFHLLVQPLLVRLAGADCGLPQPLPVALDHAVRTRAGRTDFRRARFVELPSGQRGARLLDAQGSAMIRSVGAADALLGVGPLADYAQGALLPAYPLTELVWGGGRHR